MGWKEATADQIKDFVCRNTDLKRWEVEELVRKKLAGLEGRISEKSASLIIAKEFGLDPGRM